MINVIFEFPCFSVPTDVLGMSEYVEDISTSILKVDDALDKIISKYDKAPLMPSKSELPLSEYNPMVTPMRMDKAFKSFQNSHRDSERNLLAEQMNLDTSY